MRRRRETEILQCPVSSFESLNSVGWPAWEFLTLAWNENYAGNSKALADGAISTTLFRIGTKSKVHEFFSSSPFNREGELKLPSESHQTV